MLRIPSESAGVRVGNSCKLYKMTALREQCRLEKWEV
jgi:hypothetical protein